MIVRTEAVILKSMDYRESSRILTLYTREFGKLSVLVKGARGPKSRLTGTTEPLNYVEVVFYKKDDRELQLLTQCDIIRSWRGLTDQLEKMGPAMAIIELTNAVTHAEERNLRQFELLVDCLDAVNNATSNATNAFYVFEVRLLDILGFRPDFRLCSSCGSELGIEQAGKLSVDAARGGIHCAKCAEQGLGYEIISQGAVNVLRRMQELNDVGSATRIVLSSQLRSEIAGTLRRYLQSHVEGLKDLKSESVFAAIV
jgi:DNA repair protein RecO (recombination protein O)